MNEFFLVRSKQAVLFTLLLVYVPVFPGFRKDVTHLIRAPGDRSQAECFAGFQSPGGAASPDPDPVAWFCMSGSAAHGAFIPHRTLSP
jgi:hypothetical protein